MIALLLTLVSPSFADVPEAEAAVASVDHRAAWEQRLRAEREVQIQRLHDYTMAGTFPVNVDTPGYGHQMLDAEGRPCAMAHLLWQSGEAKLVRELARKQNDVHLADVHDGPVADWILLHGLTREEVAVIQEPGFEVGLDPEPTILIAEQERLQRHFLAIEALLRADTDRAISTALDRLGDRIHQPVS